MKSDINFSYLIFLSVVAALGGFLFGYDAAVISGTISQVTEQFGLDQIQTGWFVGCALVGSIIGVLFAGKLSDRCGRKVTMLIAALFFSVSGIGCAFTGSFDQLVIARIWALAWFPLFHRFIYLKFPSPAIAVVWSPSTS